MGNSREAAQPGLVAVGAGAVPWPQLGCCVAQFSGVATKSLVSSVLPGPGYGARRQHSVTDPAQEMEWVDGGLAELTGKR